MTARYLTLKDMTGGSGCTPRTVRYYEREGLLRAARSAGGHRLFAESELERLNFIIQLREAGWALEEIASLLSAREAAASDHGAVERLDSLLSENIARLERKIAVLNALREDLTGTQSLLQVCGTCTSAPAPSACETCDRMPPLSQLPRGFRLTWRVRELDADRAFDEPAADGVEAEPASPPVPSPKSNEEA